MSTRLARETISATSRTCESSRPIIRTGRSRAAWKAYSKKLSLRNPSRWRRLWHDELCCGSISSSSSLPVLLFFNGAPVSVATSATSVIDSHFNATPSGKKLHVLVATSSYAPDRTGMAPLNADLCEYLASRGHRISVLTCFPHYPHWRVPAAYRGKLWQRESIRGVEVYRSYAYIPSRRTTLRRIAYDTSIGATVAVRGLPVRGVDVVIAVSPPLQAGLAGSMLARLKGVPFLLEIQDLVPDLAIAVGMLQNPHAIRAARKLEQNIYRQADGILVISQGFADNLVRKGVSESKISVLPLWVDANLISPGERNGPFRKTHDIAESKTVVLYTGN